MKAVSFCEGEIKHAVLDLRDEHRKEVLLRRHRQALLAGALDDEEARLDIRQHNGGEGLHLADLGLHDAGALDLGSAAASGHTVAAVRPVAGCEQKQARQHSGNPKHDMNIQWSSLLNDVTRRTVDSPRVNG